MKSAISHLRELAGLVEKKAVALSKAEWETDESDIRAQALICYFSNTPARLLDYL